MAWCKVRLALARTPQFVEGSRDHGYELRVPLDDSGHLDVAAWQLAKKDAVVMRFWQGEDDQHGQLIHTRHRTWAISYEPGEDDDTPFFHLETHAFVEGEYVSITEHDGETLPFKVVTVTL